MPHPCCEGLFIDEIISNLWYFINMLLYKCFSMCMTCVVIGSTVLVHAVVVIEKKNKLFLAIWKR